MYGKRRKRSFATDAKLIGKLDRNGKSASYGYSYSTNDYCLDNYNYHLLPEISSYSSDLNCPDDMSSYNSFSDIDSDAYSKNPRVSPMGVHINGQYINYACLQNFDDYYLSPEYTGNNNWQDSSLYSGSYNSNYNFYSSFGYDLPESILLGGGDQTYNFKTYS